MSVRVAASDFDAKSIASGRVKKRGDISLLAWRIFAAIFERFPDDNRHS